jgi:beta-galactosidase
MFADGEDASVINISVVDRQGREVPDADNLIRFITRGDLTIIGVGNGDPSSHEPDQCPDSAWQRHLFNGKCQVIVRSGNKSGVIKFEATAEGLQTGSTDIHTVQPESSHPIDVTSLRFDGGSRSGTSPNAETRTGPASSNAAASSRTAPTHLKPLGKILGADISFLPELEDRGMKFSDKGQQKDALQILKDHGFNYIRLRIFNDPAQDSGYSPKKGFCDLEHTKQMAKRIKAAGMKFLLDFHYSDTWADPGKQYKPAAWKDADFPRLRQLVFDYTKQVIFALKQQGTDPDMVQVGNEINHGMIWPEGAIANLDNLAQLIYAGISGVKAISPTIPIMLHIALGGQNDESRFFVDNMLAREVPFDVIGLSYYPKWHGTLTDLQYNVRDLAARYRKDVVVVEYSEFKKEVNEIAFTVPAGRGKGTFIWEPLNTWEKIFDKDGNPNDHLLIYDEINKQFILGKLGGK